MNAPLPALCSAPLIGFTRDYEHRGIGPPLPLWASFLRVMPDDGLRRVDIAAAARISRRAVSAILTGCDRAGLIAVEAGAGRGAAVVKLTAAGRRARDAGRDMLQATEADWLSKYPPVRPLRAALTELVQQLDLELPHFPIGYGPVDDSVTGGGARPAVDGPPRIPSHGQDWVPVLRNDPSNVDTLPLTALLSQALVAFAIDFEHEGVSLPTCVAWQQIPDDGIAVRDLPDGSPNPSGWARHGFAEIVPSPPTVRSTITLTARAKAVRDDYLRRASAIETAWRGRFGDELVSRLRKALHDLVELADFGHLPHYPRVSWIGGLQEVS